MLDRSVWQYVPRLVAGWPEHERHRALDGTMVHVDISGFTAMSERLAAKGRVGAEEVARVLNQTFTELLTVSYDLGGDMLKFGGDALLLLFTGGDHATRAAAAAAGMRSALRSIGKIDTPAGKVSLRMSVGVHSGRQRFFLVGSSHRELLVVGPGATRTVRVEEMASAGEILVSTTTAASLPETILGNHRQGARLLTRAPGSTAHRPAGDEPGGGTDALRFVPEALHAVIGSSIGEGEHRTVSVAFVHFSGTDGMLKRDGADAVAEVLDDLVRHVQSCAAEYDVTFAATDVDVDGGKIILVAGAPVTTGNDEERMLRSLRDIADRDHGLPIQIGVNRGAAFAGDVGAPFRRTYTVIGDGVNLAARVMAKARPGEILATEGILARSRTTFATEPLEPFPVKGKRHPVTTWRLGPITGKRNDTSRDVPLVGRDDELEQLEQALRRDIPPGLVELIGPAGVGKSRLLRELRERHPDVHWAFSDADEYESQTPFYPFRRALREALELDPQATGTAAVADLEAHVLDVAPELRPWLPLVGSVMNIAVPPTAETESLAPRFVQTKTHEAVEILLQKTIDRRTAFIIEDAQWLDDASRALLEDLAKQPPHPFWVFIIAHRDESDLSLNASDVVRIELGPIEDRAATDLVRRLRTDAPLPDQRVAAIVRRAGGNPLFLIELVASGSKDGSLPDSVESLVLSHIDELDPELRRVLRYASVAGASFDADLLVEAVGDVVPEVKDERSWSALADFVVRRRGGRLRFRQMLFHDVAYQGLPYRSRRMLHERIGHALERRAEDRGEDQSAPLALHFMRAEVYDKAWRYAVAAGDAAASKYANVEAATGYERALEAARKLGMQDLEVARIAERLGDVRERSGLYDAADDGYGWARRIAEAVGEVETQVRLMRKQGMLREKRGVYPQALRWFTRTLRRFPDERGPEFVELELAYAGVRVRQSRYGEASDRAREALDAAERSGFDRGRAHALTLLGLAHRQRGEYRQAVEFGVEALEIYEALGDLAGQADVLNNLGGDEYYLQNWTAAAGYWRRCTKLRKRIGDVVGAAMVANNSGVVLSDQGRLDDAETTFRDVIRVLRAAQFKLGVAALKSNLGRVLSRSGRLDEALELLGEAKAEMEEIGHKQFALEAEARIAEALVYRGDGRRALDNALDVITRIERTEGNADLRALAHRIAGYAEAQLGREEAATARMREALEIAVGAGAAYEEAMTLRAQARLADALGNDSRELHAQADAIFERLEVVATPPVPLPAVTAA